MGLWKYFVINVEWYLQCTIGVINVMLAIYRDELKFINTFSCWPDLNKEELKKTNNKVSINRIFKIIYVWLDSFLSSSGYMKQWTYQSIKKNVTITRENDNKH